MTLASKIYGTPEITFFKSVYRRHTPFSILQNKVVSMSGGYSDAKKGGNLIFSMSNTAGPLLTKCWLEVNINPDPCNLSESVQAEYINWTNNTGHAFIESVDLKIDGSSIDKHSGTYLDIENSIHNFSETENYGINKHSCKESYLKSNKHSLKPLTLKIPFKFWFNKNNSLAFPLCSLQNGSTLSFDVRLRPLTHLVNISNGYKIPLAQLNNLKDPEVTFYKEIIDLSQEELNRFKNRVNNEYLVNIVKEQEFVWNNSKRYNINISGEVKDIMWVIRPSERFDGHEPEGTRSVSDRCDATLNKSYFSRGTSHLFNNISNNLLTDDTQIHTQFNDYFNYSCGGLGSTVVPESIDVSHGNGNIYGYNDRKCDWFNECEIKLPRLTRAPLSATYYRTLQPMKYLNNSLSKHIYYYSFSINPNETCPHGSANLAPNSEKYLEFDTPISNNKTRLSLFANTYNIFKITKDKALLLY